MLTPALCRELYEASLDSVQVTLYSADDSHPQHAGRAARFCGTPSRASAARWRRGLNVSVNTPLCKPEPGLCRHAHAGPQPGRALCHCSGLIPAGRAESTASPRHPPDARRTGRCAAHRAGRRRPLGHGTGFQQAPGWLDDGTLRALGFAQTPALRGVPVQHGHCAGRHRTALPELAARPGAGQHPAPAVAAHLGFADLPPHPPPKRQNAPRLPRWGPPRSKRRASHERTDPPAPRRRACAPRQPPRCFCAWLPRGCARPGPTLTASAATPSRWTRAPTAAPTSPMTSTGR